MVAMEPPTIRYAKTSDGVNIAYYAIGAGPPLVHMPTTTFSHTQLEWEIPEYARWFEGLANRRTLVRYDGRGMGLSDRNVTNFPLDGHVLDLEAVADQLSLSSFALFALAHVGLPAIAYAARHPERVSHLILWCSYSTGSEWMDSAQVQALRSLVDKDWALYTETVAMPSWDGQRASQPAGSPSLCERASLRQWRWRSMQQRPNLT